MLLSPVHVERLVTVGQRIDGWYDAETNHIDIAKSLRSSSEAPSSYAVGDVVLAKVAMVRNGKAELVLFPKTSDAAVSVAILRADVTTNPFDDLRTLMTVGEVIPGRVPTPRRDSATSSSRSGPRAHRRANRRTVRSLST